MHTLWISAEMLRACIQGSQWEPVQGCLFRATEGAAQRQAVAVHRCGSYSSANPGAELHLIQCFLEAFYLFPIYMSLFNMRVL